MSETRSVPAGIAQDIATGRYRLNDESLFCAWFRDKKGLMRSGDGYQRQDGTKISIQDVCREIQTELSPFIKTGLTKQIRSIEPALRNICPVQIMPLKTYSIKHLAENPVEPPEFTIDGLLPVGLTILAAPQKIGKSWLCADICACVSSGCDFWGHRVNRGSVLYCDLEGERFRIQDRLIDKMHVDLNDNFFLTHNASKFGNGFLEEIGMWIKENPEARLIVIDTIGRLKERPSRNTNAYDADTDIYSPLQRFALENKISILGTTHLSKSSVLKKDDPFERIVGSGGQMAVSDATWMILGAREEAEKRFITTGRDVDQVDFAIEFDRNTYRWRLNGNAQEIAERRAYDEFWKNPLFCTVREAVRDSGGRWSGTASDLLDLHIARTGDFSIKVPQVLSRRINAAKADLENFGRIRVINEHVNGGACGRNLVLIKMK